MTSDHGRSSPGPAGPPTAAVSPRSRSFLPAATVPGCWLLCYACNVRRRENVCATPVCGSADRAQSGAQQLLAWARIRSGERASLGAARASARASACASGSRTTNRSGDPLAKTTPPTIRLTRPASWYTIAPWAHRDSETASGCDCRPAYTRGSTRWLVVMRKAIPRLSEKPSARR